MQTYRRFVESTRKVLPVRALARQAGVGAPRQTSHRDGAGLLSPVEEKAFMKHLRIVVCGWKRSPVLYSRSDGRRRQVHWIAVRSKALRKADRHEKQPRTHLRQPIGEPVSAVVVQRESERDEPQTNRCDQRMRLPPASNSRRISGTPARSKSAITWTLTESRDATTCGFVFFRGAAFRAQSHPLIQGLR